MNKNKVLAILACTFITQFAVSQDIDNRENLKFGIKAGINYSNVFDSRTEEFNADAKFGFAGGLSLSIPINKYIGLQPEVLLSQKGFKGEGTMFGTEYNFTRTTTYIDIPLQFALKPSEFFTILLGPQYSYLIRQKDEFNSTLFSSLHEEEFDNENIRRNIFGFVGGIDVNLKHVVIGARVGWDIRDNHGDGTSSTPRYKNTWFQATLGFNF